MTPLINIEYDNEHASEKQMRELSEYVRNVVAEKTKIKDVFVYTNTAKIKVQIAPVEIFVRMTASKIEDRKTLVAAIKEKLLEWKEETSFPHPINLTLIPMDWNIEIGI